MEQRNVEYSEGGVTMVGQMFVPEGGGVRPGVLVAHDWSGRNALAHDAATRLAGQGYVGFALDMYGAGRCFEQTKDKVDNMAALRADRGLLMRRIAAALNAMKGQPEVDAACTGAIGFCFGGLCVLDLARSGAEVGGVVAFHGLLDAPSAELCKPIRAQVLALHGYRDPMCPPAMLAAFEEEMRAAEVDFQVHVYGRAVHAFANPIANNAAAGTVYDALTAHRAFRSMEGFFADLFATSSL